MKNTTAETKKLKTPWSPGEIPLPEHPTPQFEREDFTILNGMWDFSISQSEEFPKSFDGKILVPFSPESLLSGVERTLLPNEFLHYFRTFSVEPEKETSVFLHFGAVDMDAKVFLNGELQGVHRGGFNSFSFDITKSLKKGENKLWVVVTDDTGATGRTYSKQTFSRGGIWYSPSSGIWQTVWLEKVPENHISNIKITPCYDQEMVELEFFGNYLFPIKVTISLNGQQIQTEEVNSQSAKFHLPNFHPWSPETPNLYSLTLESGKDIVKSYFAMRKFEIKRDATGNHRFFLNNQPYFMHGLLDQGYFSDGIYTPATDQALENDVLIAKKLGFNTLRKHIKVESMRWYHHCDVHGMLVWQDMPSGGKKYKRRVIQVYPFVGINLKDDKYKLFGRDDKRVRDEFLKEYFEMLEALQNVPSLAMWVPFNEGWGQFDAKKIGEKTKEFDPTRLVDHASGWHDQGGDDFRSLHIYFRKIPRISGEKRPVILSEFGGYSHRIENHSTNPKTFGYKVFSSLEKLNSEFLKLYETEVIPKIQNGLSASIYTQLTDVEDEVNGLVTYDRKVEKISNDVGVKIKESINQEIKKIN